MNYKFVEIFKKSFLKGWVQNDVGTYETVFALLVTFILAMCVFFIYKTITKKTFYSKNFGISLVCVSLITTAIIMAIQSNIVMSLGMVGALSIVRFRTAIKDPMDLAFLFWSISLGIVCGAHLFKVAFVLTIFLSIVIFGLENVPIAKAPMILIINSRNNQIEEKIISIVRKYSKYFQIKSRNITNDSLDLTIELRAGDTPDLIREIVSVEGVYSANLLSHDGEVTF